MTETSKSVSERIGAELAGMRDLRLQSRVRELLVPPYPVTRPWSYGPPHEYVCWTILEHRPSNTGIAFCSQGFGPEAPWGLVWLEESPSSTMNMGMDSSWYSSLEQAMRESYAWDDATA